MYLYMIIYSYIYETKFVIKLDEYSVEKISV
jgi:hypothetical protein